MIFPDAAIGSIVAAAIAGLVAFISTVLTKEQKTSEFRQVWIDELRQDISEFISGVIEIASLHKFKLGDDAAYEKFIDDNFEIIKDLQTLEHRIVLRLNPDEHSELIDLVKTFRKNILRANHEEDGEALEEQLTKQFLDTTKKVLSTEWKRVKDGEPTFRWVKKGALIAVGILLSALVVALWLSQPKEKADQATSTTYQIFQYSAPLEPAKPTRRVVKQIQNNSTIIEMPSFKGCSKNEACEVSAPGEK